jgi:prepilin-type N-terminal cleavage/methylation domain-containing protein
MNKKGFTLIELLAVVTLISMISLIVIPQITKKMKEQQNDLSEANTKILEMATDTYIERNPITYEYSYEANGSTYCIPVQKLIDDGILEKPFKNINGQEIDYSSIIKAVYQADYNSFSYELVGRSECTEVIQYINRPKLAENMIPVEYNATSGEWVKADISGKWYDYVERKWANAVLVNETSSAEIGSKTRAQYLAASIGTPILSTDIVAHYVWLPRYKYELFDSNTNVPINIVFESIATPKSTGSNEGEWLTHPAFTYNGTELTGIWVSKYESSNQNNNIVIRVNQPIWTGLDYSQAKEKASEMSNQNNIYGLREVNTHLMKNSEWGAVAYLTNSAYGNLTNDSTTGNMTGIYNLTGNKEFVILDNNQFEDKGYALEETEDWTTGNSYVTEVNRYLTRGNNSIFNYTNTLSANNVAFRTALINTDAQTE